MNRLILTGAVLATVALAATPLQGETDAIGRAVAATFAGKTAVITGAASGMGLCTSRTLGEAGATVFMVDINGEGVRKAADEINARGKGKAYAVEADVRNFDDAERSAALAIEKTGKIDLLVNFAGGSEARICSSFKPIYEQPKENRHVVKRAPLDERARAELGDILSYKALKEIDREYAGPEPDPPALASWTLRVVYSTRVRSVRIVNTAEPPAFRLVRERLEAFSKNQLGIWAIQYSRDKLVALAEEKIALGRSKWSEREVQNGNLFEAVSAYREALFYLETVDPKPSCAEAARSGLKESQDELDRRYRDQRFLADRAINLGQWDVARRELATLVEMVPDRADARNREAAAKLVDVEKRMKGGK